MILVNNYCRAYENKICSGCTKGTDYEKVSNLLDGKEEHKQGEIELLSVSLVCGGCGHKGMMEFFHCSNDVMGAPYDTVFCPHCKRVTQANAWVAQKWDKV